MPQNRRLGVVLKIARADNLLSFKLSDSSFDIYVYTDNGLTRRVYGKLIEGRFPKIRHLLQAKPINGHRSGKWHRMTENELRKAKRLQKETERLQPEVTVDRVVFNAAFLHDLKADCQWTANNSTSFHYFTFTAKTKCKIDSSRIAIIMPCS